MARAIAVQAARREGLDCRLGAGNGEERTRNMWPMVVTLEVSKLIGWLNTNADCRESKEGRIPYGAGRGAKAGGREVAGDRGASSVQGRARL